MNIVIDLSNLLTLTQKEKRLLARLLNKYHTLSKKKPLTIKGSTNTYSVTHSVTLADLGMGPYTYVVGKGSYLARGGQGTINSFEYLILFYPDEKEIIILEKNVVKKSCLPSYTNFFSSDNIRIQEEVSFSHNLLLAGEVTPRGEVYFERIPGNDLADYIFHQAQDFCNIELIERIAMLQSLHQQVQSLHCNNIVHKDIKLANIIFDEKSKLLRLIDAGCADVMGGNKLSGTHAFFPPEYEDALSCLQRRQRLHFVPLSQPSFDIYQEGIVFANILLQEDILSGSSKNFQRFKVDVSKIVAANFFKQGADDISQKLKENLCLLVKRMLSEDPNDRPNDLAVAQELKEIYKQGIANAIHLEKNQTIQHIAEIKIMYGRLKTILSAETQIQAKLFWDHIKNLTSPDLPNLFEILSENYHVVRKCILLVSQLDEKIKNEMDEEIKANFLNLKNQMIAILTSNSMDTLLGKGIAEQITNGHIQFDHLCCQPNLLILMHERFIFTQVCQGNKKQQRKDFIALLTALFSHSDLSLKERIQPIVYEETADFFNKCIVYLKYRTLLLSYDDPQLALIKDRYHQWVTQALNVEQLSLWPRTHHKNLMKLILPIVQHHVSQEPEGKYEPYSHANL